MLLLARNATRQREFSLRLAVGAGTTNCFASCLQRAYCSIALGGGLAWTFSISATQALGAWARIESSLVPDRTVLLFTLAVLVAASLLFGLRSAPGGDGYRSRAGVENLPCNVEPRCRQDSHRKTDRSSANGVVRGLAGSSAGC